MKDYARIVTKIVQTPWLMVPESLEVVLRIVDERIKTGRLDDETIDARLEAVHVRSGDRDDELNIVSGVGVLPIAGPIFGKANLMTRLSGATSLEGFRRDFRTLVNDDSVHSIVLDMDTPGGTSDLVQETGEEIFAARGVKPIYAIANTMSGSAGLWLASQATRVYSTPSGAIGSLGVYTVHQDQSGRDSQEGNRFTYVSAGPFKTEGNPHEPLTEAGRQYRQEVVDELYNDFKAAVANGRNKPAEEVEQDFGGGRMLTPKKALDVGMIDGIMTFDSLIGQLTASQPRRVQVVVGGREPVAATLIGNRLEVAEWEHSEPGTGSPPIPVGSDQEDDRSGDKDNRGIRRDTPPIVDENQPQSSAWFVPLTTTTFVTTNRTSSEHGEEDNEMKLTKEALAALGLSEDASDEAINAALMALFGELEKQRAADLREKTFAEQFPTEAKELAEARSERVSVRAEKFADANKWFTKGVGEDKANTTKGLSSIATEKVADTYKAIAQGDDDALELFGETLALVMSDAGRVEYGEEGSSRGGDDDGLVNDTGGPSKTAKYQFSEAVRKVQEEAGGPAKMSWGDAVATATKQHPKLAQAYQEEMTKNSNNRS
jgi:signal peptide peptidase SppA